MSPAHSDADWIARIAGDGVVTIGDPRLKAPTTEVDNGEIGDLLDQMVGRLRMPDMSSATTAQNWLTHRHAAEIGGRA